MDTPNKSLRKEREGMNRRDFLLLSAGTICTSMVCWKTASASQQQPGPDFVESTCRKDREAAKKVLIAYASRCGSTGGVADAIGQVLCATGASVDIRLVGNVRDLSPYQGVIVGSAIRMGRWLPEAVEFVKQHRDALALVPAAYFAVCLTMKDDTAENRSKALACLDTVHKEAPGVQPLATGLFAGAVDFSKLSFVHKSVLKAKGIGEGDFRDWASIRTWAADVGPTLLGA